MCYFDIRIKWAANFYVVYCVSSLQGPNCWRRYRNRGGQIDGQNIFGEKYVSSNMDPGGLLKCISIALYTGLLLADEINHHPYEFIVWQMFYP